MPGRLPTQADFPSTLTLDVVPPPSPDRPTNVLILLHSLGDSHRPFSALGDQMRLPETACLSLCAPNKLPFDLDGFQWGDDLIFDQGTGGLDFDTGFGTALPLVADTVIKEGLMEKCGYAPRNILVLGFGQGACVALAAARVLGKEGVELGGIVSIGGFLPEKLPEPPKVQEVEDEGEEKSKMSAPGKCKAPVLLCKARENSAVMQSALNRLKDEFEFLEVKEWKMNGDHMPRNRDEMMPIMQFMARRLQSVKGVPQGSVEVT
ncbi:Alpha/Beta hydrolase protein [Lineolata rhizophorae]|uniref:Alpha/Beta hydrolase protein n=1 Tax=Lineolata rhizophorae TaxID=578093 RepID=A0A6A6NVH2_9PEZI|nr:Alpha/Beta hydrolase protein [Lineolata rhizophorae]